MSMVKKYIEEKNWKALAMETCEDIRKKREKREKIVSDTQLLLMEGCMKRSAYCATRHYNSRVGQV